MNPAANPWIAMALNNAWANATLYDAVRHLTHEDFIAERPGFFPSLSDTLNHLYEVDLFYIDALEEAGQGRAVYARDRQDDAAALAELQVAADVRLAKFCSSLTELTLAETRRIERPDRTTGETVAAILLHLFQHQVHHRGQAHVQLSHAGLAPPQLDEFYLEWERAPSAEVYWQG